MQSQMVYVYVLVCALNVLEHIILTTAVVILFLVLIIRWQILASGMGKGSPEKLAW